MKKTDPFLGKGIAKLRKDLFITCPNCKTRIVLWSPPPEKEAKK